MSKLWLLMATLALAPGARSAASQDAVDAAAATASVPDVHFRLAVGNPVVGLIDSDPDAAAAQWLALACDVHDCALQPARLSVLQARGDFEHPSSVRFARVHTDQRAVVAWLSAWTPADVPWFHAGPVTTWGSRVGGLVKPPGPGSFELEARRPHAPPLRFVPMAVAVPNADTTGGYVLQVRAGDGNRQVFDAALWACDGDGGTDYVLWTGDLDRDGQPDFLLNFLDGNATTPFDGRGKVVLYLSSVVGSDGPDAGELADPVGEWDVETRDRDGCPGTANAFFVHLDPVPAASVPDAPAD